MPLGSPPFFWHKSPMDFYSQELQQKIAIQKAKQKEIQLGTISFHNPLLLAPMSGICHAPYRLLMEELGAGGTVSELISCHGINYGNKRTIDMLKPLPEENFWGLQLFGEDAQAMAKSTHPAQAARPKFIDINMGCPVRKVVSKGGGSALMKDPTKLSHFFSTIKKELDIPLTIKIRTGWDSDSINAQEIIHIAQNEGVEFVAVHGRTRTQAYRGDADWRLLNQLAEDSPLPFIGNGDLSTPKRVKKALAETSCQALMIGRGALRNPFIFLEAYQEDNETGFSAADHFEVLKRYLSLLESYFTNDRIILTQLKKMAVWYASGYPGAAFFRSKVFPCHEKADVIKLLEDYFLGLGARKKHIDESKPFMQGGHG